jgi:outer membrane protein assembly factor BamB
MGTGPRARGGRAAEGEGTVMLRRLTFATICLGLFTASAQAQVPFNRSTMPTRTSLSRVGLERHWYAVVPFGGPTERVIRLSLAGDMVFAQTNRANFHAFDSESGRYLWGINLGRSTNDARAASVNSDQVFVTNSKDLFAIDRRTGRLHWKKSLEALPSSPTAADEEYVMVGLVTGKLVSYTTRDHSKDTPPGFSAATFAWAWATNGKLTGRPIPANRVVAFGSSDGKVYVARNDQSQLLYRFLTGGPIVASMGTYGTRTLFVPSGDNNMYSIDLFTGDKHWVYPAGAPLKQEPLVSGKDLYFINATGVMTALDADDGTFKWNAASGDGRLLALSPSRVYLETFDRDLMVVDRATGHLTSGSQDTFERAGLNLRDYTLTPTNRLNDRLYFATPSGMIFCAREIGALKPRFVRPADSPEFGKLPEFGQPVTPPISPDPMDEEPTDEAVPDGEVLDPDMEAGDAMPE